MPHDGTVNYHRHTRGRQAYHIDAGEVGTLISPEHVATQISVRDVRTGEASVTFADDSVGFVRAPTCVTSFADETVWRQVYEGELAVLLHRELGACEVVCFDHTVRVDDPHAERKPARNVHTDYSSEGAHRRLVDILGEARASEWSRAHYAFVNVWRPITPINSAPLGFVRPSTVAAEDWVLLDLVYPDRLGHIMGLVANEAHEWVYRSRMTPDEVVYFNIYDHRGRPAIAHSAIDGLIEDESVNAARRSIESRTLVRYPKAGSRV